MDQSATTAIAVISMRYSGEVIFVISTIVDAGNGGLKYSRRTLCMASKCSMLRTYTSTRQTSARVPPAASTADFIFSQTCRVCSVISPIPAIDPSGRRAVIPEIKTSRPRASTVVAGENAPIGLLTASDETNRGILSSHHRRGARPASFYFGNDGAASRWIDCRDRGYNGANAASLRKYKVSGGGCGRHSGRCLPRRCVCSQHGAFRRHIHRVRREYFKPPLPASTMVEITKMTSPEYLIEI